MFIPFFSFCIDHIWAIFPFPICLVCPAPVCPALVCPAPVCPALVCPAPVLFVSAIYGRFYSLFI